MTQHNIHKLPNIFDLTYICLEEKLVILCRTYFQKLNVILSYSRNRDSAKNVLYLYKLAVCFVCFCFLYLRYVCLRYVCLRYVRLTIALRALGSQYLRACSNKKCWLIFKAKMKFLDGTSLRPGWIVPLMWWAATVWTMSEMVKYRTALWSFLGLTVIVFYHESPWKDS